MSPASPTFHEERALIAQGLTLIAGADEVGCGCWAGPVYAAAVILPLDSRLALIRDSKLLSPSQRGRLVENIKIKATAWAVGAADEREIETLNIRQAASLAMRRAVESLAVRPEFVLSDAFEISGLPIPCKNIIRGDRLVKSIAAASVIAKIARDAFMDKMDARYPGYGFADHKGYGTKQHQEALKRLGPCEIHRKTYEPIRQILATGEGCR